MRAIVCMIVAVAVLWSPAARADANETLLSATSPYEDMIEFALEGDNVGVEGSLEAADAQADAVRAALSPDARATFDELLGQLHGALGDNGRVASLAVRIFRVLLDALKPEGLVVPREVSLLDYAGFNLRVLASAKTPDWKAIGEGAKEAASWWNALEAQVTNPALRDAVSSTIDGLQRAVEIKDVAMLSFAVQMNLDLVDLMEQHFEGR